MAKSGLECFSGGDFEEFEERLQFYFDANDVGRITDSSTDAETAAAGRKKKSVLISSLSAAVYSILKSLCLPKKPAEKSYDEIVKLLTDYYKPEVSSVAATYQFQQCRQQSTESIRDFVNKLKRQAVKCSFADHNDRALRDQFIAGLADPTTRQEILSQPADSIKSFEAVAKMAASRETALAAAAQLQQPAEVHGVSSERKSRQSAKRGSEVTDSASTRKCYRCGKANHLANACRHRHTECNFCKKKGHLERVCLKKNKQGVHYTADEPSSSAATAAMNCIAATPLDPVAVVGCVSSGCTPYVLSVDVNGTPVLFEIDTGSSVTLLTEDDFKKCGGVLTNLEQPSVRLTTYSGDAISCLGQVSVDLSIGEQSGPVLVRVVPGNGPSLLGRDVMQKYKLPWRSIFAVHSSAEEIVAQYPELFDTSVVGKVKGVQVKLNVADQPVYHKARPVPYAIHDKYIAALDKLEADGIIEKVAHSDWASPTVPVIKPDGSIRICADYSTTINAHSVCEQYPLPTLEELLSRIGTGSTFTKLDLSQAYHHLELAPESRKYTTINTVKGLYQYTRLPFGIHSAVSIFQRVMDETLSDLPGAGGYIDDVLCSGDAPENHETNVHRVLCRLQEKGFKLKPEKCCFMVNELTYLGHKITAKGIAPTADKVSALKGCSPSSKCQGVAGLLLARQRMSASLFRSLLI